MSVLEQKTFILEGKKHKLWIYVDADSAIWFKLKEFCQLLTIPPSNSKVCAASYQLLWENASKPLNWSDSIIAEQWEGDSNPVFISEAGAYQLLDNNMHEWVTTNVLPVAKSLRHITNRQFIFAATTQHYHQCNIYRIGVTRDLVEQLADLNENSIDDFYYAATLKVHEAIKVEKLIHLFYAQFNLTRDFFTLSVDNLLGFSATCKKIENIVISK